MYVQPGDARVGPHVPGWCAGNTALRDPWRRKAPTAVDKTFSCASAWIGLDRAEEPPVGTRLTI